MLQMRAERESSQTMVNSDSNGPSVHNLLRAATATQRALLAVLLVSAAGLIAVSFLSYRYPLDLHVTLHERYSLRCANGGWQWMIARYSKLIRFDTRTIATSPVVLSVQVPVVDNDMRKLASQYAIPNGRFKQWPCIQSGHIYNLTFIPYVGKLNRSGNIAAPVVMYATSGVDARAWVTPCWLPLACVGVMGLLTLWRIHARILDLLKAQGYCSNCGYDLRMTPERCPECGVIPMDRSGTGR